MSTTALQTLLTRVQRFLKKNADHKGAAQLQAAFDEIRHALRANPQDERQLQKLGELQLRMGLKNGAIDAYLLACQSYCDDGFYQKAVGVYKQALRVDNKRYDILEMLGDAYADANKKKEALKQYQALVELHLKENRSKEAFRLFDKMEELDPENVSLLVKQGEAYLTSAKTEPAIQQFLKALAVLEREQRWDDYGKVAERILYIRPAHLETLLGVARVYLRSGKIKKALQRLQKAFKEDSDNPETFWLLAEAFERLDNQDKVLAILHQLANLFSRKGQKADAWEVYERIRGLNPEDSIALNALEEQEASHAEQAHKRLQRISILFKRNLHEQARMALEELRASEPEHELVRHFDIEWLLLNHQREKAARALLKLAREVDQPENALYYAQAVLQIEGLVDYELYDQASRLSDQLRQWLVKLRGVDESRLFQMIGTSTADGLEDVPAPALGLLVDDELPEFFEENDLDDVIDSIDGFEASHDDLFAASSALSFSSNDSEPFAFNLQGIEDGSEASEEEIAFIIDDDEFETSSDDDLPIFFPESEEKV